MRIVCVGISHKTAALSIRERLAFDAAARRRGLADLRRRWKDAQFAIISTCNRVEIYAARAVHGYPRSEGLAAWLGQFHKVPLADYADRLYSHFDADAVSHLFSVAAGLDSLVPGEGQVASQVKDAYAAARSSGAVGRAINELFQHALHVVKHVRSETGIAQGKVSIASVALDCIHKVLKSPAGKSVLSIGAGKMNQLMLAQLARAGAGPIRVANRSRARAAALAATCEGEVIPFSRAADYLGDTDILISSTASDSTIITRRMLSTARRGRTRRPLLILDLAVPRDIEPAAADLANVHLFNIDDFDAVVARNINGRSGELSAARKIVDQHVSELISRLKVHDVAPTLDALYKRMESISQQELSAAIRRLSSHADADADTEILRAALHRTIRRILHPAAATLRSEAGTDLGTVYAASLARLFDLDDGNGSIEAGEYGPDAHFNRPE